MRKNIFKSRIAIIVTLLFVLIVILAYGRRRSAPLDPFLYARVCTVAPGIHLLGRLSPAAAYVVETRDGLVLIDTGQDPECASLRAQVRELRLDLGQLRAILLTHAHADHSMGARHLKELTKATIHAGQGDAEVLRRGAPREAFTSVFSMPEIKLHATDVDMDLKGDEVIQVGEARFTAIAAPGHSPGSMCYLLEKDGLRALFTGDVVLSLTDTARFGGFGTRGVYHSPRYRADARDFLATLERLRDMPPPDLVLPGHPHLDDTPQSARVPAAQWQSHLERGMREMRTLLERQRVDGKIYLDGVARAILPRLHYLGDFHNAAVYCLAEGSAVFLFDAPGGPGLGAFVQDGLRKARLNKLGPPTVLLTSCDPEAIAGLTDLLDVMGGTVVVPREGRKLLPDLGTPGRLVDREDPAWSRSFPGEAVPLKGIGRHPAAYRFKVHGKAVLATGRVLMGEAHAGEFMRNYTRLEVNPSDCLWSLERLRPLRPDVWLPAAPQFGASAFIYDNDWTDLLASNAHVLRQLVGMRNQP